MNDQEKANLQDTPASLGWMVAVSRRQDGIFVVWETSLKFFNKNHELNCGSVNEKIHRILSSLGLRRAMENTYTVSLQNPDKYKTREELIVALTASGFCNDPAFQDYCVGYYRRLGYPLEEKES